MTVSEFKISFEIRFARRGWEEMVIKMSVAMVRHKLSTCVPSEVPTLDTDLIWADTLCHILTQTMDRILHWTRTTIKYLYPHCLQQPKKFAQNQSLFQAVCVKYHSQFSYQILKMKYFDSKSCKTSKITLTCWPLKQVLNAK